MRKITLLIMAVAAAISIGTLHSCRSSGKASATKLLKFNLEKGKGYDYEMVWDLDQKMMGHESKISIGGLYSIKVINDSDHIKTLTGTYKNFRMHMKMMGMEINVDTDKPSPPLSEDEMKTNPMGMMNRIFSGIVGKSFLMKVNEEGQVMEVGGFGEMLQGIADSLTLSDELKEKMMASLKDQFNGQTIKDNFAQVFTIFPNKAIKEGDSWEKSYTMSGRLPAKFSTTYTVKEIEGDHVTLTTKTQIESTGGDAEIKGGQSGDIIIDSRSGLMVNGDFTQQMQTKMQGMTMSINGKGKIKGKAN